VNAKAKPLVLTVGHSTRPIEVFAGLLKSNGVTHLIDVRTVPRSRHNPQFNLDALPGSLREGGIAYSHVPGLGGFRQASADSPNAAWRNASFRGYADYMQTAEFAANLAGVIALAARERVARRTTRGPMSRPSRGRSGESSRCRPPGVCRGAS